MNLFAIVSHMEAFGLVAVEAMFHRIPVIATRVGGLKDIVREGETGILVEAHNPSQIAEAINSLISNPALRIDMGAKGYERAHRDYSAQRYVKDVESLYNKLLVKKGVISSAKQETSPQ
jgi:L-malate glycosyltransferase